MNCLPNKALTSLKVLLLALIFGAGNFFPAYSAEINPLDETIRILERWTSAHWGQDCFVWVVHYPEELTEAWTESEAVRSGMNDAERERFRKSFVSELQLNTSETFLISVYSFGARPVNLSPVRENISLLASTGERIRPVKYDQTLDNPSAGVIQGLVFFPKQSNKDYVIGLKGMGRDERIFSFAPTEVPAPKTEDKPEVVVVDLPKRQPRKKPDPPKEEPPAPPPPPQIPAKPIPPIFNDSSKDMADFVRSVRERGNTPSNETALPVSSQRPSNVDNAYVSRESVLRRFLSLWSDNNPSEMYDMLSEQSKRLISRENFAKEVTKDSAFRSGLKGDYRIDWVGEERAKVITTHKTLVFRQVVTRTLGIMREGSSWRVVW